MKSNPKQPKGNELRFEYTETYQKNERLIRMLMYLTITRPDVSYTVSKLSEFFNSCIKGSLTTLWYYKPEDKLQQGTLKKEKKIKSSSSTQTAKSR